MHKILFAAFGFLFLVGCYGDTKVEFDVIGTGFKSAKLEDLAVYCQDESNRSYSGDMIVKKRVVGRVKMKAVVHVPKETSLQCRLGGEGLSTLPFIPIYNNSYKSRMFKVSAPTRIQVRLHRKSIRFDDETYDHVVFKKIDHIANKNVQIASSRGIAKN